jgi:hypothetical protein
VRRFVALHRPALALAELDVVIIAQLDGELVGVAATTRSGRRRQVFVVADPDLRLDPRPLLFRSLRRELDVLAAPDRAQTRATGGKKVASGASLSGGSSAESSASASATSVSSKSRSVQQNSTVIPFGSVV